MNKVFLDGTCGNSTWRNELIPLLTIDYFNPIVDNWTEEMQEIERQEKEICDIHLYCITKEMEGVFSIAEAIDSVHNHQKITILCVIPEGFKEHQIKSLNATIDLVNKRNGIGLMINNINECVTILNNLNDNNSNN